MSDYKSGVHIPSNPLASVETLRRGNLYDHSDPPSAGERFEALLQHRNVVIERIVSADTTSASEYVQEQDEWVVLLRGEAILEVAGEALSLSAGDYLFLAGGTPHKVTSVSAGALWLAVHLHQNRGTGGDER
jgi:cupin 2 domain-containing protein